MYKSFEELGILKSQVTEVYPKRISAFVELTAQEFRYGRQLLRIDDSLVTTKGRSLHLPLRGSISAARVAEATTPGEQTLAWSTTEVTPFKIGTYVPVSQEAIDGTEINVINGLMEEAGLAMADYEDQEIFWTILGRTPLRDDQTEQQDNFAGDGSTKVFTLTQNPVLEMGTVTVDAVATTAYTVDYYDGAIEFTTAPPSGDAIVVGYRYSSRGRVIDANTAKSLTLNDLNRAKSAIRVYGKVTANVVVTHDDEHVDLLETEQIIDTSRYGSSEPIMNGEIGKILGLKILVTTRVPAGVALVLDTRRAGWLVIKRNIDAKIEDEPSEDSVKYYFYQEFAPQITDDNAVAIVVNCASNADKTIA
jgi:N4-gp56 family major capsid protein